MLAEMITNGRAAPHSPRFQEVKEGLALAQCIRARIAELEQADRDATMQLTLIRSMLKEYNDLLTQSAHAATIGTSAEPPTPREELT